MSLYYKICHFIFQLQCCGIEGPKDWDRNNYFNCSSSDIGSREACGVPFSCCKRKPNVILSILIIVFALLPHCRIIFHRILILLLKVKSSSYLFQEIIKNKQCGYDVRKPSYVSITSLFYR